MEEQKRTGATIQWAKFTLASMLAVDTLSLLLNLKAAIPQFIEGLPDLLDKLAEEIPKDKLDELRAKTKRLVDAGGKEMPSDFERMWLEMIASRMVDQFEFYLTQLLARILSKHPGALGDSQVLVRDLLECRDINEAVDRAVERKVRDLAFGGLSGIATFFEKQFHLSVDTSSAPFRAVAELIEVRHLIVHNGGCVDRVFLGRTGRTDLKLGEPFPITPQWTLDGSRSLSQLVDQLDRQVISHFKL